MSSLDRIKKATIENHCVVGHMVPKGFMLVRTDDVNNLVNIVEGTTILFQFRFKVQNKHCVDFGEWQEWETCNKMKFNDLNLYISEGKEHYEVRELIVKQ